MTIDLKITLQDAVDFIQDSWKHLILAGVFGVVLGLGYWLYFPQYRAELVVQNNDTFDIISWRDFEKFGPNLALKMIQLDLIPKENIVLYKKISTQIWWTNNIKINQSLTRSDIKNLIIPNKNVEANSSIIKSFTLFTAASNEKQAIEEVNTFSIFLKNAATIFNIMSIINRLENHLITVANNEVEISKTKIEINFLETRLRNLLSTRDKYTNNLSSQNSVAHITVDKETIPYLPIGQQIIGVSNLIYLKKEELQKLYNEKITIEIYKGFSNYAKSLLKNNFDSAYIILELKNYIMQLRNSTSSSDLISLNALNSIGLDIGSIEVYYLKCFNKDFQPVASKSGSILKNILISLLSTMLVAFFILIVRRINSLNGGKNYSE